MKQFLIFVDAVLVQGLFEIPLITSSELLLPIYLKTKDGKYMKSSQHCDNTQQNKTEERTVRIGFENKIEV